MAAPYECFEISVEDGIAHLQLNRPDKANSLTLAFWSELPEAIDSLSRSGKVRVLVLSAQGKVFCGGLDLQIFATSKEFHATNPVEREAMQAGLEKMQDALNALERARFPVIAAVQGTCVGAGFDLIAACDLCFASEAAKFRIEETNVGMMADLGVLQRLQHLVPAGVARYLALTGETLSAAEAFRLGLLVNVFPTNEALLDGVFAVAKRIAERPPVAISGIKKAMLYSRDHGVYESLQHTVLLQSAILSGEDILRSVQARTAGTPARFADLAALGKAL
ncbi:TPA: enoyl-CoA hydratase-related protein [Pseudomonas aeruginosa]|uniref:enoyl-CoA hydratase-related protein n=1 Tax=Pseudomonas citronellolis TaxID=53408 RepID=UPI001A340262|nr:enoyl-CoA hydratase-related protein [Pseudomonas citronellolis]MBH3547413.1 enoyl-CoA hydratase/isomerase family protein [Pseudomonas aeruginosa]UUC47440.1 enoyl-CoA hydratase-related protein [Pseudomonas citronellolis]HBN9703324.1 enoyl-CoA hydratase/isomerase family protein [Pseudomonas aeruginosa]HBN9721872.1 enoyl-CoA hydratase/isomerase family protein [Pseudomonas aeruginosa]HBN9767951.1 enoyl-CoA hydratase/isomerase family protein [Pseudomonas aeruginosa]